MKWRSLRILAGPALVLLITPATRAEEPTNPAAATLQEHIMLAPDEIEWSDCSPAIPPGARCAIIEGDPSTPDALFTFRIKMPDAYRIAPHFHPADEHVTILSGTARFGMGAELHEDAMKTLPAGGWMVMPKGEPHYALIQGETVAQVHAIGPWGLTYVDPADDPRN